MAAVTRRAVDRLRVIHLASGDLWAGAEVATFHLVCALTARDDVSVSAVVLNEGELSSRLAAAGVDVAVEPEAGRGLRRLAAAVRGRLARADLVHAHRYKEDVLAALSGRPWVATQHGRPEPFTGAARHRMRVYEGLDLAAKRLSARAVVGVSEEVLRWLRPRVGAGKAVLGWNGIADPALVTPTPPWTSRAGRVGVLARLVPVKDVGLAIDVLARAPGLALEIVGDGPERGALEQRARASGAGDRIVFRGFDPSPLAHVGAWRAVLVTSHHEGNPIGVLEAIALGTPVVHPGLPGVTEILAGADAGNAGSREPGALASALVAIVHDEARGRAASEAARARFLEAFTAERAAARMAGLYRAVLEGRSPR